MVQFSGGSVTIRGGILYSHARARARGSVIFLGFWQFSSEGRLRPTILRFSKKVYFLRGSKIFLYHYMQEVVPCCAIFAKLQNSLIQPRTSQKKFSLFENVSFLVNPKIGGISERYCSDLQ